MIWWFVNYVIKITWHCFIVILKWPSKKKGIRKVPGQLSTAYYTHRRRHLHFVCSRRRGKCIQSRIWSAALVTNWPYAWGGLSIDNTKNVAVRKLKKYMYIIFVSLSIGWHVLSTSNFVTIANGHFDC